MHRRTPTRASRLHDELDDDHGIPWWILAMAVTGLLGSLAVTAVLVWAVIKLVLWAVAQ